jgi:hypothetical protein
MAILKYYFNYNCFDASAIFELDNEVFKEDQAQVLLDFFSWEYDEENDPIDELIELYAMKAIEVATAENYNTYGVISWFEIQEGFMQIDGSQGLKLVKIDAYEFQRELIETTKEIL